METSGVVASKKSSESNEEVLMDRARKKSSSSNSNQVEAPGPCKAKAPSPRKAKALGSITVHRYRDQLGGLDIQGISSLLDLIEKVAKKAHLLFSQMYIILYWDENGEDVPLNDELFVVNIGRLKNLYFISRTPFYRVYTSVVNP